MYGPLVAKTLVENWANGDTYGWIPYTYMPAHPYYAGNNKVILDPYGPGCAAIFSKVQCHKNYPMSVAAEVMSPVAPITIESGVDIPLMDQWDEDVAYKFWTGLVVWYSVYNYWCLIADSFHSGVPYYPKVFWMPGEGIDGNPAYDLRPYNPGTYLPLKIEALPNGNATAYIDNSSTSSLPAVAHRTVWVNAPPALIMANDSDIYHSAGYFKPVTISGVIVAGIVPNDTAMRRQLAQSTNVTVDVDATRDNISYFGVTDSSFTASMWLTPFIAPQVTTWEVLQWVADIPAGTDIKVQICDEVGVLLSDSVVTGNSAGISLVGKSSITLGIPAATCQRISLRLSMTPSGGVAPKLFDIYSTFSSSTDALSFVPIAPRFIGSPTGTVQHTGTGAIVRARLLHYGNQMVPFIVTITNQSSQVVRTINASVDIGSHLGLDADFSITWDGKNNSGTLLTSGTYNYSITTDLPLPPEVVIIPPSNLVARKLRSPSGGKIKGKGPGKVSGKPQ